MSASGFAHLAGDPRVVPVNLDPAEPVAHDRLVDEVGHPAAIALGVDEREAPEPVRAAGDDARHLAVGGGIVRVEGGEEHAVRDAGGVRSSEVVSRAVRTVSQGPVNPSPVPAWQWQSMITGISRSAINHTVKSAPRSVGQRRHRPAVPAIAGRLAPRPASWRRRCRPSPGEPSPSRACGPATG